MKPKTILDVPSDVLSCIFEYFPFEPGRYFEFGNRTLHAGSLVSRQFAAAARPKLWEHVIICTDSISLARTLFAVLSKSTYIQRWVRHLYIIAHVLSEVDDPSTDPRCQEVEERSKILASLIRLLPAVRVLRLEGERYEVFKANENMPAFQDYPVSIPEAIFECILGPHLSGLYISNLHHVPFAKMMHLCHNLNVLDVQLTVDLWENNYPTYPPPGIGPDSVTNFHPLRRLVLRGYQLEELLQPQCPLSPISTLLRFGVRLTHLTLFGRLESSNPQLWSNTIISLGPDLQYLSFTLDHYIHNMSSIPGMNTLDLGQFKSLKTLDIGCLAGACTSPDVQTSMEQLACLISTSTTLERLRLHIVHRDIRSNPLPEFNWNKLDEVLCQASMDVKVSVSAIGRYRRYVSWESTTEEDPGWEVVRRALPVCSEHGRLVFCLPDRPSRDDFI